MADDEVGLPRATINKMIRDAMPKDARLSSDCCEKIMQCCNEFINLVSSEANEICTKEGKSTILPDHVVKALKDLQYHDLLPGVQAVWDKHKSEHKWGDKKASKRSGADKCGMSQEEQIALQQQMFAAARARSMTQNEFNAVLPQQQQPPSAPSVEAAAPGAPGAPPAAS